MANSWRRVGGLGALALMVLTGVSVAQEAPASVSDVRVAEAAATRRASHLALWGTCRSCAVDQAATPAERGAAAASATSGARRREAGTPRGLSPYGTPPASMPAVGVVTGTITGVSGVATGNGRGIFMEYTLAVSEVPTPGDLRPVAVATTIVVTRPGGTALVDGKLRKVSVAGYPALATGQVVTVTLVPVAGSDSYQELSLEVATAR